MYFWTPVFLCWRTEGMLNFQNAMGYQPESLQHAEKLEGVRQRATKWIRRQKLLYKDWKNWVCSAKKTESSKEINQSSNTKKVVIKEMHALSTEGYMPYIHDTYAIISVVYPPADFLYYFLLLKCVLLVSYLWKKQKILPEGKCTIHS